MIISVHTSNISSFPIIRVQKQRLGEVIKVVFEMIIISVKNVSIQNSFLSISNVFIIYDHLTSFNMSFGS